VNVEPCPPPKACCGSSPVLIPSKEQQLVAIASELGDLAGLV
jgi:hypothetical protein